MAAVHESSASPGWSRRPSPPNPWAPGPARCAGNGPLGDCPAGLLESAHISEAQRCGTHTVVAFAPATADYAKLLRRTRWQQAGIDARLVTVASVTGRAMAEVPRRLGQAFTAFWNHQHASYPPGIIVEPLG